MFDSRSARRVPGNRRKRHQHSRECETRRPSFCQGDRPSYARVETASLIPAFVTKNAFAFAFVADIYTIDVSFQALKDKAERDYLNQLPTSFALSDEAVDRLRAAAATIIL